jgi:zinc and cadmium transporter
MESTYALIAAVSVMFISLLGVMFTARRIGAWMRRYLTYLTTFSAGVFLLIAWHLAQEAVHEGGWIVGIVSVVIGAVIMEGIHYLLPTKHHHHGHAHDHAHTAIDGRRVLLSDALHNIGDGILLVGAFASNIYIGIAATVGVLLHEAVQEISEYFVLREAGYTNREALKRNFLVSSTILIGFFLATYLSSIEIVLALLSGIAAGGFLSVVFHDLLPHAIHSARANGGALVHIAALVVGGAAMFGLQTALPHEESEEEEIYEEPAALVEGSTNHSLPSYSAQSEIAPIETVFPETELAPQSGATEEAIVADGLPSQSER